MLFLMMVLVLLSASAPAEAAKRARFTSPEYGYSFVHPAGATVGCRTAPGRVCVLTPGGPDVAAEVKEEPFDSRCLDKESACPDAASDEFVLVTVGGRKGYKFKEGDVGGVRWTVKAPLDEARTLVFYISGCRTPPSEVAELEDEGLFGYGVCGDDLRTQSFAAFHEDAKSIARLLKSVRFKR
jgi:hypothetical protein